jgi:hypothetical protein
MGKSQDISTAMDTTTGMDDTLIERHVDRFGLYKRPFGQEQIERDMNQGTDDDPAAPQVANQITTFAWCD